MADKTPNYQLNKFFERMDQVTRSYQRAIVSLAAERIAEVQDQRDFPATQVVQSKRPFLYWAGNIFRYLILHFSIHFPEKRAGGVRAQLRNSKPPSQIVIDISPLDRFDDQSPLSEDDIDHLIDKKKGDQPHE